MKLPIILLLLLSGAVSLATGNGTICEVLDHHRYKEMGLLSFTWYYYGYGLLIITEPPYRYYSVPVDRVHMATMDLTSISPSDMADSSEYRPALAQVKHLKLLGAYTFFLRKYTVVPVWSYKHVMLMITERGVVSGFIEGDSFKDLSSPDGNPLPEFTMAGLPWDKSNDLTGYVLSSDFDRFPGIIMLSEYKVSWEDSKVTGLPLRPGQTDDRSFFFLQVMDNPSEVFLVHSSNKPDPHAQLLATVPRAFLFDQKHLMLFDTANGCVHVIHHFAGFSVTETESRPFTRDNYPFEVYFQCGKPVANINPNRCNVVRGTHRPTVVTPEHPQDLDTTESATSFSNGVTTTVCLLVAVLAVGLLYAIVLKKMDKGENGEIKSAGAGKSTTSSSAIGGTSKRSGKSTTGNTSSIGGAKSIPKMGKTPMGSKTSTPKSTSRMAKTPTRSKTSTPK